MADIIDNDLASRTKYKISFKRLPNVVFNATSCNFPSVSLGVANINTPFKTMGFAGTALEFSQFQMSYLLNETHSNYGEILHWMEGIGFPESFDQEAALEAGDGIYSDFTVSVLTNAGNPVARYTFTNAFPTSLSSLDFTSQDDQDSPIQVTATFEFMIFRLESLV